MSTSSVETGVKPIRFGMIGCGQLGVVHAERLTAIPGVSVAAVTDPFEGAMDNTAAASKNPEGSPAIARFTDYKEMLKEASLDAVCISSPNPWHVEQILASLEAGLDVLCEKPLSMEPALVQQVIDATKASGRKVMIGYQSRYRRDNRVLRRCIQSGKWGRVTSISVFTCEDWITPNVGTWRHDPARCPGGFFADANGHQIDLLFWLTGLQPDWVKATMQNRGTPNPMVIWGESRLSTPGLPNPEFAPDGIPFTFMFAGHARHWSEEIRIQTEGADFILHDTKLFWAEGAGSEVPFPDELVHPEDAVNDTPDTAFIKVLREGAQIASEPHTVWPVLQFTLAGLASAASGQPEVCVPASGRTE
jgi:predicted dehydrogenase